MSYYQSLRKIEKRDLVVLALKREFVQVPVVIDG
jgi:hypothetical protein